MDLNTVFQSTYTCRYYRDEPIEEPKLKRVLDAGAKGILAPMIETTNQMEKVISACRYPPLGSRGMGLARAQGYGENLTKNDYILNRVHDIEIYAQIESMKGVKNCKEIFMISKNFSQDYSVFYSSLHIILFAVSWNFLKGSELFDVNTVLLYPQLRPVLCRHV